MSAVAEFQPMFLDDEDDNDLEIQFDPKQFEAVTPYTEDLNDEYQHTQDQLRLLRQQEEQIKRQTAELEELTQKEAEFKEGRAEVCEALHKHLSTLDREATEAQRIAEDCGAAHERLESHLANIDALRPESWSRSDRKAELARAIGYIEAAEDEIENIAPLLGTFGKRSLFHKGKGASSSSRNLPSGLGQGDFMYWLKSGFAFSLPLVGFALVGALIVLFF